MKKIILLCTASTLLLSGCMAQFEKIKSVGKEPAMESVEAPMAKESFKPLDWQEEPQEEQIVYSNSLWEPGSRTFFETKKARRVGDILKVLIKVKDKAAIDNETKRSRVAKEDSTSPTALGLENFTPGFLPKNLKLFGGIALDGSNSSTGTGTIDRAEIIETEVAAMITQLLPNGNLVIHGDQEIRVNFEIRKVTVDGIVRPQDISATNDIDSSQIAEARISYGGRGHITDIQQPRLGHQVLDVLSPF